MLEAWPPLLRAEHSQLHRDHSRRQAGDAVALLSRANQQQFVEGTLRHRVKIVDETFAFIDQFLIVGADMSVHSSPRKDGEAFIATALAIAILQRSAQQRYSANTLTGATTPPI